MGTTYEFKIAYKSVARMFYLERPGSSSGGSSGRATKFNFVISLDDPVRQGTQVRTRYGRYSLAVRVSSRASDTLSTPQPRSATHTW